MELESAIAWTGLALGACERMFLAGLGMQEYREVAANLAKARVEHLLRSSADHDPVALADWPAEQAVANRAADQIDFHRIMLRDSLSRPVRLLAAAAAIAALQGCYYAHLAAGQMEMNRKREPIAEVIARPATDESLKRRLEPRHRPGISRCRNFASRTTEATGHTPTLGDAMQPGMFSPQRSSRSSRSAGAFRSPDA